MSSRGKSIDTMRKIPIDAEDTQISAARQGGNVEFDRADSINSKEDNPGDQNETVYTNI